MDMNSEIIFEVLEKRWYHPDITHYDSFGVQAFILTSGIRAEEETVWDVSSDRGRLEAFAAWCMRGKIHPKHLRSMVEDEFDLE